MIKQIWTPRDHQAQSTAKMEPLEGFFDMSDPGTGKTFVEILDFSKRRAKGGGRALVVCPKSIMQPAWGDEIDKSMSGLGYGVALAKNREAPFLDRSLDIVITNHDALKQVAQNGTKWLKGFDTLIIDESTAVKNPDTQRFKAARTMMPFFQYRRALSGTPYTNTVMDFWAQTYLLDRGERLGNSYFRFRNVACTPYQTGPMPNHIEWRDKEGIEAAIYDLLSDISIRHKLEDCVDIPPNEKRHVEFALSPKALKIYKELEKHAIAELGTNVELRAVHAAALQQKLLQIAAGAVYTKEGEYTVIDDGRIELVADLVEERQHSLVLFQWKHQRDMLVEAARKRGWPVAVIDGEVTDDARRTDIVRRFQAGEYKALFAHPKSAGHGLTLTRGTATIWVSPTWSSEMYTQANARIYRSGQTQRTETIMVEAMGTVEREVYEGLERKLSASSAIMSLLEEAK